jgi:hypothetical protein
MSLGRCLQHLESRSGLLEQGDKDLLDRNMLMALQMADAITRVIGLDADRAEERYWQYWSDRASLLGGKYYV